MSRAFVKEDLVDVASEVILPDRPISPHPNLVTESGMKALERDMKLSRDALAEAAKAEDLSERNRRSAIPLRDIRYYSERLRTAQLVEPTISTSVGFGHEVSLRYDDGRELSYRIVGEDEADPNEGSISFASPLARNLMGKSAGDIVTLGKHEIEILSIS